MRSDRQCCDKAGLRLGAALWAIGACLVASQASAQAHTEDGPAIPAPPPDITLPEVETVIAEDEFESAVPDFPAGEDPELDVPIESIEAFERRLSQDETTPSPEPASMEGERGEEVGDAPIRDAELTKPLPPLEQFELKPVEFAEDESRAASEQVRYETDLTGLEEADKLTPAGLRSMFKAFSALLAGKGKAANASMVQARLAEDRELVATILATEGWYSPAISTRLDVPQGDEQGPLKAVIDVSPGKRYSFSSIAVDAQPTTPPGLIRENLALRVGEPIVAEWVQGAEAQVSIALAQEGYPFVELGPRAIVLDRETGEGSYLLPVDTGPRSVFGGFETQGDLAFDADHIDVIARFDRGELYDSRKVDDLRKALVATGLFSSISVEPKQTGQDAGEGNEYVTVMVNQDAGPPRTIAGSAGYGTGEGFTLEGSWTHHNMFPPEGALIVHGLAGTKEQGAGVSFRRSNAGKRDQTFELAAEVLHSAFDAYSAYTGRLGAQWRYSSTPIWQKRFTYSFGAEALATAERDYDYALGRKDRRLYYIASVNGQAGIDSTDDLLDPTRGYRATLFVRPESSLDGGFNIHVRSQLDASAYFPVGKSLVLAGRVRVGSIQGAALDNIAPSRRFYAGGGGSVRGYAYQKLGDLDPDGDPRGGRSLNEASAEVRYRFGNFGVVGFFDAGQSYTETLPRFSSLRYGAGIGGRYYTNFGPLRIDLATPINRRPGESRINLYISIGQAF